MNKSLEDLILEQALPKSYLSYVQNYFAPIAKEVADSGDCFVLGVQGTQGSGKSTCSEFLKYLLEIEHGLKVVVLSIDDFYLTKQERLDLCLETHPLLAVRGVPGTHDVDLAIKTIDTLKNVEGAVAVPRFNKATDDRYPESEWDLVTDSADIVILEGWFVGLESQVEESLETAINELEKTEDADGVWRKYVNDKLATDFQELFAKLDKLLVLQAPSFDCVYNWRLKQEEKMIARLEEQGLDTSQTLTPKQVRHFISYFERLTEEALKTLPQKADWCLQLSPNHEILGHFQEAPSHLVFTDLDGTFLDHYTYDWSAAKPALKALTEQGIPVVINTSKTAPEVIALQKEMSLKAPFSVENGSALYIPKGYFANVIGEESEFPDFTRVIFGAKRTEICPQLYALRDSYGFDFKGYSDWSIQEVMEITGLDAESAEDSLNRFYSEPLIWNDSEERYEEFKGIIAKLGYKILQGGRFIHILGQTNKAEPIKYLANEVFAGKEITTIALGDSPNDIEMLECTDWSVWVKSPKADYPKMRKADQVYCTEGLGPIGWNEAINKIILEKEEK